MQYLCSFYDKGSFGTTVPRVGTTVFRPQYGCLALPKGGAKFVSFATDEKSTWIMAMPKKLLESDRSRKRISPR